jgi:hypothetical protein
MNKNQILITYKKFIKLAKIYKSYNFQEHALRKIRYDFVTKPYNQEIINKKLDQLNRIILVQNLYYTPTLVPGGSAIH